MATFSVTDAMVSWIGSMGYSASTRPNPGGPKPFVTVERTGGGMASMVDHPIMAVQAWADTEEEAEALANELRLRLVTENPPGGIHSVRVNAGPYAFFDEATRLARYQLALDVACQLSI